MSKSCAADTSECVLCGCRLLRITVEVRISNNSFKRFPTFMTCLIPAPSHIFVFVMCDFALECPKLTKQIHIHSIRKEIISRLFAFIAHFSHFTSKRTYIPKKNLFASTERIHFDERRTKKHKALNAPHKFCRFLQSFKFLADELIGVFESFSDISIENHFKMHTALTPPNYTVILRLVPST